MSAMTESEYLSKDILDEDFFKGFVHIWRLELILGMCRVDARHRFITAPTVYQKIYSVAIIAFVIFGYYQIVQYNRRFKISRDDEILFEVFLFIALSYYAAIVVHLRFLRNRENAQFYIKLSHCDRYLKRNYREATNNMMSAHHRRVLLVLLLTLCPLLAFVLTRDSTLMSAGLAVTITQITALIDVAHCSGLILSFTLRMRLIYYIMAYHLKNHQNYLDLKEKPLLAEDRILETLGPVHHSDFHETPLDLYIKEILNTFYIYQDNYRFQVFLFRSKCITTVVCVFRMVLLSFRNTLPDFSGIIVMVTLVTLEVMGIFSFCCHAEIFQWEVSRVKVTTINIMAVYPSGPLRDKAKNIFELLEHSAPTFSVYGMWQMRAYTFIGLLSSITWFIVTVLQFEFL